MYGLPKDFDGSFFLNRNLEMICFNANQIYFHFDSHVVVMVEGSFSYQQGPSDLVDKTKASVTSSNLMQLLEHKVVEVRGDTEGTLTLFFDDKKILKFFDTPGYESYQIKYESKLII